MAEAALVARGLVKSFGSLFRRQTVHAVRDLDLRVHPGEVVALVGPNGAGKTTTLRLLLGFLRPDRGSVRILGNSAGSMAACRSLGYVGERFRSYRYLTSRRLLRWLGSLSGVEGGRLESAITGELERLDLSAVADRRVGRLSQGELQRLGLAQALLHHPRVLILDEPTTGLDPEGRRRFVEILRAERDRGAAVLLSSHVLAEVERVCDRVIILRSGRIVAEGSIPELTVDAKGDWQSLETAYLQGQEKTP